ncbi:MAG: threonylcarbamoyl-AMP synthase [Lachnospiraceae bacterium]|nr:threonylcarbamoyl-AMP synthase [Lachnospiraceae bacterium]
MKTIATKIYKIKGTTASEAIDSEQIYTAGQIIREGGLVAFPTETVYGLGGNALDATAAKRIFAAKGRPEDNPLIVHLYRSEDAALVAKEIPPIFHLLAENFWPGPLTMILPAADAVPRSTTASLETVAVRIPRQRTALALIEAAGGFVAAPSANTSGRPSPTTAQHVIDDLEGRVELILDDGDVMIGLESTIIDLTASIPVLLRPGAISEADITRAIGMDISKAPPLAHDSPPLAPGMKYRHYAPHGQMILVDGGEEAVVSYINAQIAIYKKRGSRCAVIADSDTYRRYHADSVKCVGSHGDGEAIARNLYRVLRELDDELTDVIFCEAFTVSGIGAAITDRLYKAASGRVIRV